MPLNLTVSPVKIKKVVISIDNEPLEYLMAENAINVGERVNIDGRPWYVYKIHSAFIGDEMYTRVTVSDSFNGEPDKYVYYKRGAE